MEQLSELERNYPGVAQLVDRLGAADVAGQAAFVYAPGRIELLGKHTDYAGGTSMTCASTKGMTAVVVPTRQAGLKIVDSGSDESAFIPWTTEGHLGTDGWAAYPRAVVHRLRSHFGQPATGVHIVFSSDIPRNAGMSSSSALITLTFLACAAVTDLTGRQSFREYISSREELATFLGAVESGSNYRDLQGDAGVGTRGGSQDHSAILCSAKGQVGVYRYRQVQLVERIDFPEDMELVVGISGVEASKRDEARAAFNSLSDRAARIATAWAEQRGISDATLADTMSQTVSDAAPTASFGETGMIDLIDRIALDPDDRCGLLRRYAQFHDECGRVIPEAVQALRRCDWPAFASAARRSQQMAEDWLENQVRETVFLAKSAYDLGAVAASAFGAGFGGSVWALVSGTSARRFRDDWMREYRTAFPSHSATCAAFIDRPADRAHIVGGYLFPS